MAYLYYKTNEFNLKFAFGLFAFVLLGYYLNEIYSKKKANKYVQELMDILLNKYKEVKVIDNNNIEFSKNDNKFRFYIDCEKGGYGFSYNFIAYLDISEENKDLINKLKIHFYCTRFENRDWIRKPIGNESLRSNSIKYLTSESQKVIDKMVLEKENYAKKLDKR